MKQIIDKIITIPAMHSRWLNTLSMMENAGAKKIKNCEDPVFVNEIILKHSAEEARHAYYLKKQISKIEENACPTYERKYLLDRKSTRLNSSHTVISYAVFCLKKKKNKKKGDQNYKKKLH